jgi:hypothetical protein
MLPRKKQYLEREDEINRKNYVNKSDRLNQKLCQQDGGYQDLKFPFKQQNLIRDFNKIFYRIYD